MFTIRANMVQNKVVGPNMRMKVSQAMKADHNLGQMMDVFQTVNTTGKGYNAKGNKLLGRATDHEESPEKPR